MTVSDLMKAMADAGAPFEAILIAVRAIEAKDAEIAERDRVEAEKRAKDAERKRVERLSKDNPRTVQGRGADAKIAEKKAPIENKPPVSPKGDTAPKGVKSARREKFEPIAKPDDVSAKVWDDFRRHRHAKRAPISGTVLEDFRLEAEKAGWTLEAAMRESITRGWQGFKAKWLADQRSAPAAAPGSFLAHLAGQGP